MNLAHSTLTRRVVSAATVTAAAVALVAAGQTPALAATSGYATCMDTSPVVGVWVNVSGGSSGWASRTGSGYQQRWNYNTQGKSYSLTVGCGGTTSNWAHSTSTPNYSTGWSNVSCYPGWGYGGGTLWVKDRCYAG